jgi:hypothetical protein
MDFTLVLRTNTAGGALVLIDSAAGRLQRSKYYSAIASME